MRHGDDPTENRFLFNLLCNIKAVVEHHRLKGWVTETVTMGISTIVRFGLLLPPTPAPANSP
jgi:hypothetical protein